MFIYTCLACIYTSDGQTALILKARQAEIRADVEHSVCNVYALSDACTLFPFDGIDALRDIGYSVLSQLLSVGYLDCVLVLGDWHKTERTGLHAVCILRSTYLWAFHVT